MASLTKKIKKGKPYYYIVESRRINGKPRIVNQIYLGSVETIRKNHQRQSAPTAQEVAVTRIGPLALWDVACSLDLPKMIDAAFPKRKQGPSVSQYLLLAALGRAFAPCSKVQIGPWYEQTALKRKWGLPTDAFTSQHFWNAMDRIRLDQLTELEKNISVHVAKNEQLSPKLLLYDCTNYFTYIDTLNDRNTEAQRGRNKQGRHNLRQLGLATAVTPEFHIPLFHTLYQGNLNDITQFKALFPDLTQRLEDLSINQQSITLVFDKGNSSEETLLSFAEQNFSLIASSPLASHPEEASTPLKEFQEVDPEWLPGIQAWRGKKQLFDHEWTIIVEHSAAFAAKQHQSVVTHQAKAIVKLEALSKKLKRGEMPKVTRHSLQKSINRILASQYLKKIIDVTIVDNKENRYLIRYSLNHDALHHLINDRFGRTLLLTNQHDWPTQEIILGYRNQSEVERIFQESKNTDYLSFQPTYHWTDHKLHVHSFYCTLALLLTGVLRRRLAQQGCLLPTMTLLEKLHDIREATLFYPPDKAAAPPRLSYCKVKRDKTQNQLFKRLNLSTYCKEKSLKSNPKTKQHKK